MQTLCESWRRDLDALRRVPGRGSLWGGGRDAAWEDAGSVRVDASCFKVQDLLVETWRKHTPLHASQPPTLRPHTSYPPAPVTVAVREEERVVPIGRPVLLLAHLALEPGARGQRLVATQLGAQQSLCVYGSEEATGAAAETSAAPRQDQCPAHDCRDGGPYLGPASEGRLESLTTMRAAPPVRPSCRGLL